MLDLVNPVGAGRGLVGGGREAGLDEARPFSGKPLTHTLNQHAPNLGGRGEESNLTVAGPVPIHRTCRSGRQHSSMVAVAM